MEQKVADHLIIDADTTAYSQALNLNKQNRVHVEAVLLNGGGTAASGVDVQPEYSNDLQTWSPDAVTAITTTNNAAPYKDNGDFTGPNSNVGAFTYLRVRMQNKESFRVLISSSVTLYSVNS